MSLFGIMALMYALFAVAIVLLLAVVFAPAIADWRWRRGRRGREGMLR